MFVPKNRRPKFDLNLKISDLNNVPLVSGTSFIKWDLPHSTAAEHRGRTSKCHIKDHKVTYDYEKTVPLRLTVDKNGVLSEAVIQFEVLQEYFSGSRAERIRLGRVKLNLAEYVNASDHDGEEGISRRYLMQESKINSTLKVEIYMKLVDGDGSFIAPALKTAPVFGGIAGIMANDQADSDDVGHMPSLSSKARETGEAQDLYRRNLAAYWTAQPGELRADECIEDIFAGGDGWGDHGTISQISNQQSSHRREWSGGGGGGEENGGWNLFTDRKSSTTTKYHDASKSSAAGTGTSPKTQNPQKSRREASNHHAHGVSGRVGLEQQAHTMRAEVSENPNKSSCEVDEFEIRDDLRSWKLPEAIK